MPFASWVEAFLKLNFKACLMLRKFGEVDELLGPMKLYQVPRKTPTVVLSTAEKQMELAAFAQSTTPGRVAVLRVEAEHGSASAVAETSERFALVERNAMSAIVKKNQLYAGEPVEAGGRVVDRVDHLVRLR